VEARRIREQRRRSSLRAPRCGGTRASTYAQLTGSVDFGASRGAACGRPSAICAGSGAAGEEQRAGGRRQSVQEGPRPLQVLAGGCVQEEKRQCVGAG
jgi:hypothetical protein